MKACECCYVWLLVSSPVMVSLLHPLTLSLPVCGKYPTFDPERPADSHWPWLAAIYRRSNSRAEKKVTNGDGRTGPLKADGGAGSGAWNVASDWQLVCSGALVNLRSVVVAAHCVTDLGKVYPLDAAKLKVVVGKRYRDDQRETKGPQHLRVSARSFLTSSVQSLPR